MNETFPAEPISVETFAQRVIALDVLRHALVDLWDFSVRMSEHPTGWIAADVLRLEEIRQLVETERPTLAASRETAEQFKAFLAGLQNSPTSHPPPLIRRLAPLWAGDGYCESISPREKSNDEYPIPSSLSSSITTTTSPPFPQAVIDGEALRAGDISDAVSAPAAARKSAGEAAKKPRLLAGRSTDAPRKAAAKIRSRGAAGRRRRRKNGEARRRNPKR